MSRIISSIYQSELLSHHPPRHAHHCRYLSGMSEISLLSTEQVLTSRLKFLAVFAAVQPHGSRGQVVTGAETARWPLLGKTQHLAAHILSILKTLVMTQHVNFVKIKQMQF